MSKDKQKTYDAQTAKFLAVLVQNMPLLDSDQMQSWIEHPKGFQRVLTTILTKDPDSLIPARKVTFWDSDDKANYIQHDEEPISVEIRDTTSRGSNPFELLPIKEDAYLRLGVEYDSYESGSKPVLRPWLDVYVGDYEASNGVWMSIRSLDYWKGHSISVCIDLVDAEEKLLVRSLFNDLEKQYADDALSFLNKSYQFTLASEEIPGGWEIILHWMKDGLSHNSFRFFLMKSAVLTKFKKDGKSPLKALTS